ncbi:bifunctional methylenetetrahydrofolate dehydrogenase/cyclohydrolase, mitochondrial-like [Muntiacus reevesi]|uniref:bifunctional methylenetetrahydrofolate dehydrogenase/cyclohydrolase, mitochondrial-like n=1 Tax=Muntiacus reevesi TaxID=9886 RepID=UPI003306D6F4
MEKEAVPGVLRLTNAPPCPHWAWSECGGARGCGCECAGASGHRRVGGGTGTPELPGPLLREGKVETGSVPTAKGPGPGSRTDTSMTITECNSPVCWPCPVSRNVVAAVVSGSPLGTRGIPKLITSDMVKEGATVIDVGINYIHDPITGKTKLVGDVDFKGELLSSPLKSQT